MEKMPLKWLLVHQLTFVMAFLYVLLDLTNEVSSGTVTLAKDYMDKLLTQVSLAVGVVCMKKCEVLLLNVIFQTHEHQLPCNKVKCEAIFINHFHH